MLASSTDSALATRGQAARAPAADDSTSEVDEESSPLSTPHMSISLFLDGDTATSTASSNSRSSSSVSASASASASSSRHPTFAPSPRRGKRRSPSASQLSVDYAVSPIPPYAQPTELYFQSGDVIFVVPPSPAADYSAVPSSFEAQPVADASPSSTSASTDGTAGEVMMRSLSTPSPSASPPHCLPSSTSCAATVLHPSVHIVNVYILPSLSCVATLRGHDSCVEHVYRDEWCDASDQVITQTQLGSVYVWTLSTGELVQRMEARSSWLSAFLMTRRLFPLPAITQVSGLKLDDSQLPSIASTSTDDEDDAMLSGASPTVSVYENQRFYPLLGWSSKLLPTDRPPFSNARGTRELSRKQFKLLPRWRWTSGWEVVRDEATDVDGWSYAIDFSSTSRRGEYRGVHRKAFIHTVRRRKWVRHRQAMYQPTAEALASSTLDDYIEHKQTTPLQTADSPQPDATHVSFSHSLPIPTAAALPTPTLPAAAPMPDKPSRSTPLLSPTPIQTRSRKSKTGSPQSKDRLPADEPRAATRPTSRSSASDQEPPSVSLSLPPSPSPRSAHVVFSSSAAAATAPQSASSSTSTSPSLPSPTARRRHASATSRQASIPPSSSGGSVSGSSPPASPSTLSSVLTRVKPSDELKLSLKRMLLSHNGALPAKSVSQVAQSGSSSSAASNTSASKASASASGSASSTAATSTRPRAARTSRTLTAAAGNDALLDEQKERPSSSSHHERAPTITLTPAAQHSKLMVESKEADNSSLSAQRLAKDKRTRRKKVQGEADERAAAAAAAAAAGRAAPQNESVRRKKPISYATLPSPPRSSSDQSLHLPTAPSASSSSSSSSSAAAATRSRPVRVEVWENQRNYPVLGWSSRLLPTDPYPPFSDAAGHVLTFEMCELMLPLDMDWLMDWTVQRSADMDADGWQYAVDWSWEWSSKQRVLTTVRRRCWVREKALRTLQQQVSKRDSVRRRKQHQLQRFTTLPSDLLSVGGKRRSSQASNPGSSHSRSQSLYGVAGLTQSSSMQSLSSLAASSTAPLSSFSSATSSSSSFTSSSGDIDADVGAAPSYYDPSAGEPEEL